MNDSIRITTLSNGFRIVTENMPGLASASLGIWVNVGGRHERLEQNGIAHFLEHMAFKGTKRRTALEIAQEIENVGGYINAYTSREVTAYYARILQDDVPLAFDVISDIVLNSIFDAKELETERGVILQEIGQSLDTPDDVVFDWLQEISYPDQSIGRTILGSSERVKSFSQKDLQKFIGDHYGPEQMVFAAAGAVDHDALVKASEIAFGSLKKRIQKPVISAQFHGGEKRVIKSLEQAHFTLGLESVGYRDEDIYTAQIFASAFGGGMSSRLFQEAREKRGLCYTIFAQAGGFSDTGLLTIYAGTSSDDIAGLAELTIDELKRSAQDMDEAEVNRARTQFKAGMLMGLESPSSRCERLARMMMIWNRIPSLEEVVEKIDAVSVKKVRQFAENICIASRPAMALYGPVDKAPNIEVLSERLAG